MSASELQIEARGGVRLLTLNRPQRRNAIDTALAEALVAALRAADREPGVGALVLAAAGTVFSSGADIGEFKGERADPVAEARRSDAYVELLLAFRQCAVPVVAAVHGHAIGLGAALVSVADMAVLGESARVSYPEVPHGMMPGLVAPVVQAFVPGRTAFEMLMLGTAVGGAEALACGIASRVVPDAEVGAAALALAARLAALDGGTVRSTKRMLAATAHLSFAEALRAGRDAGRARAAVPGGGGAG
ncbi:MAG: enoyl-CoA hydratase/isomerase family protein [Burkholderiales bacterium]|nr:enoyl-CoA hydratase/isomerase family protein [Burkholderiales bacterium]